MLSLDMLALVLSCSSLFLSLRLMSSHDNLSRKVDVIADHAGKVIVAKQVISAEYAKCSKCRLTVARYQIKPDGSVVCANCEPLPRETE